jgi:hypothetical protein
VQAKAIEMSQDKVRLSVESEPEIESVRKNNREPKWNERNKWDERSRAESMQKVCEAKSRMKSMESMKCTDEIPSVSLNEKEKCKRALDRAIDRMAPTNSTSGRF